MAHWQHQPASAARDTLDQALFPLLERVAANAGQAAVDVGAEASQPAALTTVAAALERRGLDAAWLVEAERVKRAEAMRTACRHRQAEARLLLHDVVREARAFGASVADLRALVTEESERRVPLGLSRYRFDIDTTDTGFRATATGVGEMEGDVWVATATAEPLATADLCATLPVVTAIARPRPAPLSGAAPDNDALLGAVATLSRTIDPDATNDEQALVALSKIALLQIGIASWRDEHTLDEARLTQLVDTVNSRGGRLGAIVAATVLSVCNDAHAEARERLADFHTWRRDGSLVISSLPSHYTYSERGAGATLRLTLTGTGLMRGDVITMTAAEHDAHIRRSPQSDFCTKKAAAYRQR